jgi:hypothetical protein
MTPLAPDTQNDTQAHLAPEHLKRTYIKTS